ncbi:MAG: hypothetical protein IGS03_17940 [Candidatus Sericytochromatia bacterium]|nr:hypothetical protein [Candidatus Sericytochromatia bacterium]
MQTERCSQCGQSYLRETGVRSRDKTPYCSAYCLKLAEGAPDKEDALPPGAFDASAKPSFSLTPWVLGALLLLGLGLGVRALKPEPPAKAMQQTDSPIANKTRSTSQQTRAAEPSLPASQPTVTRSAPPTALLQRLQAAQLLETSNPSAARREVEAILAEQPMPEAYQLLFRLQLQANEIGPALTSAQNCLQLATELKAQAQCHQLFVTAYTHESTETEQPLNRNLLRHLDALMALENRGDLYLLKARVLCADESEAARSNLDAGCAAGFAESCELRCIEGQVQTPPPQSAPVADSRLSPPEIESETANAND